MTAMRWNINYRQFVQNKHNKVLKDQPKILAPALRSIWNEFQNHIQMTGNLNVYYLVMFIQNLPVTDEGKQLVRLEPWTQWFAWNNSALPEMRYNSDYLKCL